MKYYAILKQKGEGCDYTIGCGQKIISFEADSTESALEELALTIGENYTGDYGLTDVHLFPADSLIPVNVKAIYKKLDDEARIIHDEYERKKDLEQFEKLKAKLKM